LVGKEETITVSFPQEQQEMIKHLARHLYEVVGLEGYATWTTTDWKITNFQVQRILPFKPTSPDKAFSSLAEAAAGRWNDVDAEDYVRNLRSGDDEE
jgi:hypothetical protein